MNKIVMTVSFVLGGICTFMGIVFITIPIGQGLKGPGFFLSTLGSLLLLIGLALFWTIRSRMQHLREHGHKLVATITSAHLDYRNQINHAPQLILYCQGTDPITGHVHTFHTKLWSTLIPQESLRGYEVEVLFDPLKPDIFKVLFQTLRRPYHKSEVN